MSEPLKDLTAALRRLELSENQQTVFLTLLQDGQATARSIAARSGLTRPSVYDQLKTLRAVGLVVELAVEGKTHFAAIDLKELDRLLADKIERIERSRESLAASLPALLKNTKSVSPKIRFFEGGNEVKNILKDVLWNTTNELVVHWPSQEMANVFDAAYIQWFVERLQIHKYEVKVVATSKHPFKSKAFQVQVKKTMPPMATLRYGYRVAHISSSAESFGFIVESAEYSTLLEGG